MTLKNVSPCISEKTSCKIELGPGRSLAFSDLLGLDIATWLTLFLGQARYRLVLLNFLGRLFVHKEGALARIYFHFTFSKS